MASTEFVSLTGESREQIVYDLLDRMLSCSRFVLVCATDCGDGNAIWHSTLVGGLNRGQLRIAHRNALTNLRLSIQDEEAGEAVDELLKQ